MVPTAKRASWAAAGRLTSMKGGSTAVKKRMALGLAIWTMKPSIRPLRPRRTAMGSGWASVLKAPRRALIPSQAT
ncbi:hypothetical protein D9M68_913380 [compost metagenome]